MSRDNHDPVFDDTQPGMIGRFLPPLVLICALGGFVALAIYAYQAGTESVNEGDLMVIEADKTPMKEKPEDPGGMQFPNQDKTIFETIAAGSQTQPKVERVLPSPEEPMPKDAPANWANDKLEAATPAAGGSENMFAEDEGAPAKAPETPVAEAPAPAEANVAQTGPKVVNLQEAPAAPVAAVEPVAKPVEVKEAPVAEAPVKPFLPPKTAEKQAKPAAEKPAAAAASKPSAGKALVQLGAYKSASDAKADFAKLQKKHAALSGKAPVINRADLGDKGVFYRLRVATDDAKKLCASLAGQACMAVK